MRLQIDVVECFIHLITRFFSEMYLIINFMYVYRELLCCFTRSLSLARWIPMGKKESTSLCRFSRGSCNSLVRRGQYKANRNETDAFRISRVLFLLYSKKHQKYDSLPQFIVYRKTS